jgi:DNA-binding HxlR family transcriptional regulator
MKKQLEHKLKELEDSDVIEKVQGPTPWVSPLVVIPKANSDIHICVDMRCANKAV